MTSTDDAAAELARYTGPYERWVFTRRLGRPFAFPAIAKGNAAYFSAIAEGEIDPAGLSAAAPAEVRLPPLWNPDIAPLAAVPFAFHRAGTRPPALHDVDELDAEAAELLACLRCGAGEGTRPPRYRLNFPVERASWATVHDPAAEPEGWIAPAIRPAAIVGVIDDGIPFAQRAFLGRDGRSRISHCWLQAARAASGRSAVPFGREFANGQIDRLRAGFPDERQLYREAGAIDADLPELGLALAGRATHGAHIAGLCAGNDPHVGATPMGDDIQIVAVQLPNTIAWDTSGFGKEMYMLSALHYILARARRIAAQYPDGPAELPLVVNFSYGWSANRHDGGATMERAVEQLLARRRAIQPATALVMPMGNNFEKRMHARIVGADLRGGEYTIDWHLPPDDHTASYLEIWFPEGIDPAGNSVSIRPPEGVALDSGGRIALDPPPPPDDGDPRRFRDLRVEGKIVGQLSADKHMNERWRVLLALIPTSYTRNQPRRAAAGSWRITIRSETLAQDEAINIWLQRDDDPGVLRSGGRQSHLIDPKAPARPALSPGQCRPWLDIVRGFGTFNGIASSAATTRVGGYVGTDRRPSRYSGAGGLTRTGGNVTAWSVPPTLSAPADQGIFRPGLPSIGVLSGSGARLQGTSAAAALASRWMVLNLASGRPMYDGLEPVPAADFPPADRALCDAKRTARLGGGLVPS
ncbi:hypothetical protein [Tropicimonas sp.]|uniref:hypothetical protein n=1 Tax=Tropicimonas sp. TaxID=2067044 RepID=UPI003A85D8CC